MVTLSPHITPTKYVRSSDSKYGRIEIVEYGDWSLNTNVPRARRDCDFVSDGMARSSTEMGDVYICDGHSHVDQTLYDTVRLVVLRELILREISLLVDDGVVENLEETDRRTVTAIKGQWPTGQTPETGD